MKSQATRIHKRSRQAILAKFACLSERALARITPHKVRVAMGFGAVTLITLTALVVQAFSTEFQSMEFRSIEAIAKVASNPKSAAPQVVAAAPQAPIVNPYANLRAQKVTVRSGDSLSLIFDKAGFGPKVLYQVVSETEHGKEISQLYPGKELTFYSNDQGELVHFEYQISPLQVYLVDKSESGYESSFQVREPDIYAVVKSGDIQSSFYLAGLDAGLSDNVIMQLAGIFGWDIDFALEIRKGDRFSVIYEDQYLDGQLIGTGNILAAEFVNQGRSYRALRHTDSDGRSAYYTPEGDSMRKAFLRSPLDVFRISSNFDPNRKHPILNTIRAHNGTDYAAASGTPIRATGSGRVVSAEYSSSYGNVVTIQHGQNYKTRYAHMKSFARGIRTGSTVEQGQIIGYVGMTGLATGPHLHYEFYANGVVRNPVTVELPNGEPLKASELIAFKEEAAQLLEILDNPAVQYAGEAILPSDRS